jgi:ABC-2 type transport system ATP-binding protein
MIEARGLRKAYGGREVLAGLDLDVPRGTVTALLGPNGAGKTTTVRILATLARPDAGSARVGGHDVVRERSQVRRLIGLTGQAAAVDDLQTGRENLRTAARLAGLPAAAARRRTDELLERFDLVEAADRVVSRWSGGMRRRIDLAAGLVAAPAVLFLDEPTTGLDPRSRLVLWEVVTGLVAEGTTVLLTTQYLDEADRLADEVAVLDQGRVVARGTPAALKQQVSSLRLELELTDADALAAVRTALGERVTRADEGALTLETGTDGSASAVRSLLDEVDPRARLVTRFAVHGASLDDVFLALTGPAAAPTETEHARV